uniref:Uncharacterized protein n=1 Tax=Avena sativa TaxID=4498 RepID=A0ACD5VDQ0_AVESA
MQQPVAKKEHQEELAYTVRRRDPELVGPAAQTPRERKRLSELDDVLRVHIPLALFYRGSGSSRDDGRRLDPARVIRDALGEALVQYYPLAGRLQEMEGGKLVVDCTGEGVLFVEADADVQLAELEAAGGLTPPFPCWDQLLFDHDDDGLMMGVLNSPLLLIQVTRLLCGGFVLALRFNHTICDGIGIAQFMNAVGELARGLPSMTVTPVWSRELLAIETPADARPTTSTSSPHFVDALELSPPPPPPPAGDMVMRSFVFSASDVDAIKRGSSSSLLPRDTDTSTTTTFEALAAFIWRARTVALHLPAGQAAPLAISANFRVAAAGMSLPAGYYGNASPAPLTLFDAAALSHGSLGDAVAVVRQLKATVTAHYFRSILDVLRQRRRWFLPANLFSISDTRRIGLDSVDLGWGTPVFAGPADTSFGVSFFITLKDDAQENPAVVVPIVLPQPTMDRFTAQVESSLLDLTLTTA